MLPPPPPPPPISVTNGLKEKGPAPARDQRAETWTGTLGSGVGWGWVLLSQELSQQVRPRVQNNPTTAYKQGQFVQQCGQCSELVVGVTMGIYSKYLHTQD